MISTAAKVALVPATASAHLCQERAVLVPAGPRLPADAHRVRLVASVTTESPRRVLLLDASSHLSPPANFTVASGLSSKAAVPVDALFHIHPDSALACALRAASVDLPAPGDVNHAREEYFLVDPDSNLASTLRAAYGVDPGSDLASTLRAAYGVDPSSSTLHAPGKDPACGLSPDYALGTLDPKCGLASALHAAVGLCTDHPAPAKVSAPGMTSSLRAASALRATGKGVAVMFGGPANLALSPLNPRPSKLVPHAANGPAAGGGAGDEVDGSIHADDAAAKENLDGSKDAVEEDSEEKVDGSNDAVEEDSEEKVDGPKDAVDDEDRVDVKAIKRELANFAIWYNPEAYFSSNDATSEDMGVVGKVDRFMEVSKDLLFFAMDRRPPSAEYDRALVLMGQAFMVASLEAGKGYATSSGVLIAARGLYSMARLFLGSSFLELDYVPRPLFPPEARAGLDDEAYFKLLLERYKALLICVRNEIRRVTDAQGRVRRTCRQE